MKRLLNKIIVLASLCVLSATLAGMESESDWIAVLNSSASIPDKCAACQKLRLGGTARAIPALAALLEQERLSHAARYALEGIPNPRADQALRNALNKTSGSIKAGLVDSLGWRRDRDAVPQLTALLEDDEAIVASSAAAALGRIGTPPAIGALIQALPIPSSDRATTVQEAILQGAERIWMRGNHARAAAIYQRLLTAEATPPIQIAAWCGLIKSNPNANAALLIDALGDPHAARHQAALQLVRELKSSNIVQACLRQWDSLPPKSQLAVLDAHFALGSDALDTIRRASLSAHSKVRIAAWEALAERSDILSLPALTSAAAQAHSSERSAARNALRRWHGSDAEEQLLSHLSEAPPAQQVEIMLALGDRANPKNAEALLRYARADSESVRLAAWESLSKLAVPSTLGPLLDQVLQLDSDPIPSALLKALQSVCQMNPDRDQASGQVVDLFNRAPDRFRRQLLILLPSLGTDTALTTALAFARDSDPETIKEALRTLARWPDAAPAAPLLELTQTYENPTLKTLALRGGIEVTAQERSNVRRLELLNQALSIAKRVEEKRQVLSQIGTITSPAALEIALNCVEDPELGKEAGLAAISIAEKLSDTHPNQAAQAAGRILSSTRDVDTTQRAWALRAQPVSNAPFIQDWLVCGPYRREGVVGAQAVFDVPFGPELEEAPTDWRTVPRGEQVNLASLFPGQDHCAAYLKAILISPGTMNALLLLGSDDGVKAWLNGALVHGNNVDRGEIPDQDMAPIQLIEGRNELLLKITQGAGGWSARARIVDVNGQRIAGFHSVPQSGAGPMVQAPAPALLTEPKPAVLPPHDDYQKIQLSPEFYAEGAYYGDFNQDGALDIVAGPFWFPGPEFVDRFEYRPATVFDPKNYSDNFLTYADDLNGDGWTDILCVPFPGREGYWYQNPQGAPGHWPRRLYYPMVGNESPLWGDLTQDGRPELMFCNEGHLGYAGPDPRQPEEPWIFHPVSTPDQRFQRFTHGIGYGDINGDQRLDMIEAAGWWEQPAHPLPGAPWSFHPFRFAEAGAQMLVNDVDDDGHADIITAWHCHHYGLIWWRQIPQPGGAPDWKKNIILSPAPDVSSTNFRCSQMHAMELVDMNGDGLKDILTGKRFWAHGPTGDKEPSAPALVFWYELQRQQDGEAKFVPHLIDDDSGVGTQVTAVDLNNDDRPDVIVANKKGIFVHLSRGSSE